MNPRPIRTALTTAAALSLLAAGWATSQAAPVAGGLAEKDVPAAVRKTFQHAAGEHPFTVTHGEEQGGPAFEAQWKNGEFEATATPEGALIMVEQKIKRDALHGEVARTVDGLAVNADSIEIEAVTLHVYEVTVTKDGEATDMIVLPSGQLVPKAWLETPQAYGEDQDEHEDRMDSDDDDKQEMENGDREKDD